MSLELTKLKFVDNKIDGKMYNDVTEENNNY